MSAIAAKEYVDLDVIIDSEPSGFVVRIESDRGGQAEAPFEPPFTPDELELFLLRLARPRRAIRRVETPQMEAVKQFGQRLFDAVFAGELRACLRTTRDDAARQSKGLRIRLRPVSAPELADVPWEFLFHASLNRFLALSTDTPIVRYLELPEAVAPLTVTPPLRVLVAIAGPVDLTELDVEQEWQRLHEAVANLEQSGVIALERLDHASLPALQHTLRKAEYHVFHFVGHGAFDERLQDGVLMMEDANGRGTAVSAQRLGTLLHDHRSLRLAVLNACEGARTDVADPFAGVAQTLVQQGLAAVIAMQFEVSDIAAITLANEFYGALADGYPIEAAMAEARKAIFNAGNDTEWATPVLYLRATDGRLFDLQRTSENTPDVVHAPVEPTRPEALPLPPAAEVHEEREAEPEPDAEMEVAAKREALPRAVAAGLVAAVGLAAAYLLPLYTTPSGTDVSWHSFSRIHAKYGSVFSSLEMLALIAGTALAAILATRPRWTPVAAGLLTGFGIAGTAKGASTLWWIHGTVDTSPKAGAYLLLVASVVALAAGIHLASASPEPRARVGMGSIALAVFGAALMAAAVRIPHRSQPGQAATWVLHKWHALGYEAIAVALIAVAVVVIAGRAGRTLFAGGFLLAVGAAALAYWTWFAGVPTIQDVRGHGVHPLAGGFIGVGGALLLLVAGWRLATPLMPSRRHTA